MHRWIIRRRYLVLMRGWFAWELQVGPLVFQWVHKEQRHLPCARGRRLLVWRAMWIPPRVLR